MGQEPSLLQGYPPPEKRGHRMSPTDTLSQQSRSSESDLDFELQRETFGVSSISEKFSLLSRPPSSELTRLLQTKRCFSMHVVRGHVARSMQKKERQRRDPSHRPPLNREFPFSSPSSSPELTLVPRPQWIKDAQSDMSDDEADEIWRLSNERMFEEGKHLSTSMPDVSSFTGGNTK
jgi:hypothetical protein